MKQKPANYSSELQRQRRMNGWDRIIAEQGRTPPTRAQREMRRKRNERYRNSLKQPQQKAA